MNKTEGYRFASRVWQALVLRCDDCPPDDPNKEALVLAMRDAFQAMQTAANEAGVGT